jgi:hypothetical protein
MAGCKATENAKAELKYEIYQIEKVKYLPAFSSSTPEYFLEKNLGVLFTVNDKNFSADTANATAPSVHKADYENVLYIEENLHNAILTMGDSISRIDLSSYDEKTCFKVMSNSKDTGFRIYYLDNEIWIAHFSWYGSKKNAWWADYIFSVS